MRLSLSWRFVIAVLAAGHVFALQCSSDRTLRKYSLDGPISLKGDEVSTPPSTTWNEWYFNLCDNGLEGKPAECNDDDMLCVLQWVHLPDKEPFVIKAVHCDAKNYMHSSTSFGLLTLHFADIKWGNSLMKTNIHFFCDLESEADVLKHEQFDAGEYPSLYASIEGPSGCVKPKYAGRHDNDRNYYSGEHGLSWFTWFLIYLVLFVLIYFVIVSYLNKRGGSFRDFRDEFVDRTRTNIVSLASFIKEILARLFNRSSTERGGYSAV